MSTTDHVTTGQPRSDGATRQGVNWWQAIIAGTVAATVVNLLILLVGRALGASFELLDGASVHAVTVGGVISSSVVPLVAGTVVAALLGLWWPGFVRLAQVVGGGLALLSVAGPMMAVGGTGTRLALAAMHVVVAVAVVLTLEPIWRRARARRAA
jgi:hypothetical protein